MLCLLLRLNLFYLIACLLLDLNAFGGYCVFRCEVVCF